MPAINPVISEWLASAGLSKYSLSFAGVGEEEFLSLLMQDYGKFGVEEPEDKQRFFRLIKRLNAELAGGAPEPGGAPQHAGLIDLDADDGDLLGGEEAAFEEANNLAAPKPVLGGGGGLATVFPNAHANPVKIRVVVRKRPINKKELDRGDKSVMEVRMDEGLLLVGEPKVKVDLTEFVQQHNFVFDDALDHNVDNDTVYRATVQPLVHTIFKNGKATCFAYGQTGSGKTFTMSPLPIRSAADIFQGLALEEYLDCDLYVSCFEIYGGKLFDLLNGRKRLETREDGKKQVCIVGLKEYVADGVDTIKALIDHANAARSTGSTGANDESSRSHSIMQFALKRTVDPDKPPKLVGKISFIDLAGSERGADTYENNRQTRLEGAEINKSLLALKECIRGLDSGARHVPFRGSKLTEVLRDSFIGKECRTVMIANVSPAASCVEHSLNTLRYADRVKELRKEKHARAAGGVTPSAAGYGYKAEVKAPKGKPIVRAENAAVLLGRQASAADRPFKPVQPRAAPPAPAPEPARPKPVAAARPRVAENDDQVENMFAARDELMNTILEEEDELIQAHRKHIEDTMEVVRLEMNLLAEVDQPGSAIDAYVDQLQGVLARKAAGIAALQRQLELFKGKLNEEEMLTQSIGKMRAMGGGR